MQPFLYSFPLAYLTEKTLLLYLVWFWLLLCLWGCGGKTPVCRSFQTLSLVADEDMNKGQAMAVDVVSSDHPRLTEILQKTPASQYFRDIDQLRRSHPAFIKVWRFPLTPNQKVLSVALEDMESRPDGLFIFADYQNDGEHRIAACSLPHVSLELKADRMEFLDPETPSKISAIKQKAAKLSHNLSTRFS